MEHPDTESGAAQWSGTIKASDADHDSLSSYLFSVGICGRDETLTRVFLDFGDNEAGAVKGPSIRAEFRPKDRRGSEKSLREVDVDLSFDDFLSLFKRLSFKMKRDSQAEQVRRIQGRP